MRLTVERLWPDAAAVVGMLYVDGKAECYTLERPVSDPAGGPVCIPPGTFPVRSMPSEHFQRNMPHVCDVPGRTAIEIHIANKVSDLKGCLGLGKTRVGAEEIGASAMAFTAFEEKFNHAIANGEAVTLTIPTPEQLDAGSWPNG